MGNSTIIELNHDRWWEISDNPEVFVAEILDWLRCIGDKGRRIPGGNIIYGGSRYDGWYGKFSEFKESVSPSPQRDKKK